MTNATEMKPSDNKLENATVRRVYRPFRSTFATRALPLFHAFNAARG